MTIFRLPSVADPLLSVVMVTYGGWDWPFRAIEALSEHTLVPFEAIFVDNASWDGTGELLEDLVEGARIVRNKRNVGFAGAANQGAELARGEYLCFLNPDCLVETGWFRSLRDALGRPGVGAVIPRFLDPDGTVQEAGSVVDRQGWTEAVGRGAAATDRRYLFSRVVDYGSAACLVIGRRTFFETQGFDPLYYPAYCEDVDLAFRLAQRGLRTLYEPRSTVVHAGTVSTNTVTRDRLIDRNRRLLMRRWGELLADRPPLTELEQHPSRLLALRDAASTDRVLVLSSGSAAAMQVASEIAARWLDARVTLVEARPDGALEALLAAGVEVASPGDLGEWLGQRRFHYTAVLGETEDLTEVLDRTQPQADRSDLHEVLAGSVEDFMASIGATPPLH